MPIAIYKLIRSVRQHRSIRVRASTDGKNKGYSLENDFYKHDSIWYIVLGMLCLNSEWPKFKRRKFSIHYTSTTYFLFCPKERYLQCVRRTLLLSIVTDNNNG